MAFVFTYNSYAISDADSAAARPLGSFVYRENADRIEWSVDFILQGSSASNYDTLEATMRTALEKPEKAWTIARDSVTIYAGNPTTKSAFLITPDLVAVPDDDIDSESSARWRLTVTSQRPWPRTEEPLRRDARWELDYTSSRQKFLTITGVYTAGTATPTGTTAYAAYLTDIATYAAAVIAIVGGTFELVGEGPIRTDSFDGLASFSIEYRELVYTTAASGVRNESIVFAPSRAYKSSPLRLPVTIAYSASVNKGVTGESALVALWDTITTTLAAKAVTLYSRTASIVQSATRDQNSATNTISGTVTLLLVGASYPNRAMGMVTSFADAAGKRMVTLNGVYHAVGATGSRTAYTADIGTWSTAALATIDGAATWRVVNDVIGPEDDDAETTSFTRIYEEVIYSPSASIMRSEAFGFTRIEETRTGSKGPNRAVRGEVTYRGVAHRDQAGSFIADLWESTLRAALLLRLSSEHGGIARVESETFSVDPQSLVIVARMVVWLDDFDGRIVSYQEAIGFRSRPREVYLDRYDGEQQSYHHWTQGVDIFGVGVVEQQYIGAQTVEPDEPRMPAPPIAFGANGSGKWRKVQQDVDPIIEEKVGLPGATYTQTRKTTVTIYRWVSESSVEVGASADGGVTVPQGGAFVETVIEAA